MSIETNKTYKIRSAISSTRMLNLYSSGTAANGMNVVLYTSDDSNEQKWLFDGDRLRPKTDITFCLDRYTASTYLDNADIWKASAKDAAAQKIKLEAHGIYYYILLQTKVDGKDYYLTASNNTNGNATAVGKQAGADGNVYWAEQLNGGGDYHQLWFFTEDSGSSSGGETGGGENGQKLRLPINGVNTLSASRTTDPNSSYAGSYNGSSHYGADIACSAGTILKGLGNGTVVGTGYNTKEGYFISVKYLNCIPVSGGTYKDLIVRYFHMKSVSAKLNDAVTTSTTLGESGNTGEWCRGAHVHVEVDTDTAYPNYTPSLQNSNNNGGGLYKGTDSCENPFDWFFTYSGQSKARYWDSDETWVFPEDLVEHSA